MSNVNDSVSQTSETPLALGLPGTADEAHLAVVPTHPAAVLPFQPPRSRRVALTAVGRDAGRLALLTIMRETGLSVEQLAERVGVKRQSLQTYLYQHRTPTILWLNRLLSAAGGRLVMEFPL